MRADSAINEYSGVPIKAGILDWNAIKTIGPTVSVTGGPAGRRGTAGSNPPMCMTAKFKNRLKTNGKWGPPVFTPYNAYGARPNPDGPAGWDGLGHNCCLQSRDNFDFIPGPFVSTMGPTTMPPATRNFGPYTTGSGYYMPQTTDNKFTFHVIIVTIMENQGWDDKIPMGQPGHTACGAQPAPPAPPSARVRPNPDNEPHTRGYDFSEICEILSPTPRPTGTAVDMRGLDGQKLPFALSQGLPAMDFYQHKNWQL